MMCELGEICQVKMIKKIDNKGKTNEATIHQKTANCVQKEACIKDATENANKCRFHLHARGFMAQCFGCCEGAGCTAYDPGQENTAMVATDFATNTAMP